MTHAPVSGAMFLESLAEQRIRHPEVQVRQPDSADLLLCPLPLAKNCFRRQLSKPSLVVTGKSTEVAKSQEHRNSRHGPAIPRGSHQFGPCQLQADRPQVGHRCGVSELTEAHLQSACADS